MLNKMRPTILVALAFAIAGYVLTFLCFFAGNRPGFMEDYQIVTVNTSTLGHNLIPTNANDKSVDLKSGLGDLISSFSGFTGQLNNIIGDVADKLAHELGIQQWYGLHLRNMCQGVYKPSPTDPSARFDVKECSTPSSTFEFKLADVLNKQLAFGPFHISLKDLNWPDSIQEKLDQLSAAFHAAIAFYIIPITLFSISIITCAMVVLGSSNPILLFTTWILLGLASLSLLLASIIVSVASSKASHIINDMGNKLGVYAYTGHKFLVLSWSSMVVALLAFVSYAVGIIFGKKKEGRELTEKLSMGGKFGF